MRAACFDPSSRIERDRLAISGEKQPLSSNMKQSLLRKAPSLVTRRLREQSQPLGQPRTWSTLEKTIIACYHSVQGRANLISVHFHPALSPLAAVLKPDRHQNKPACGLARSRSSRRDDLRESLRTRVRMYIANEYNPIPLDVARDVSRTDCNRDRGEGGTPRL